MSKGVMKTKPVAKKAETPKPDPYANYTTGELADMIADKTDELQKTDMTIEEQHKDYSNEQLINAISNTLVALDRQSQRVNELNEQMDELQQSMQKAYLNYKQLQDELAKHLAQVELAQKALDNLRVSMDGYSKALTARVNKTAGV